MNASQTSFQPQKKETLKDWVTKELRKAIIGGRLKPGERLNESRIAKEMNLSKTPLREAINELISIGILVNEPFKGTMVKGLTKREAQELYSLRAVLESFALDLAFKRIGVHELQDLEGIVLEMEEVAKQQDLDRIIELDLKFHHYLVELSGHQTLLDIWEKIYGRITLYVTQKSQFFNDLKEDAQLHRLLLEIIAKRDIESIKKVLGDHMYHYAETAIATLNE
jgi:DNA-binding GntR family transcriptional regulator